MLMKNKPYFLTRIFLKQGQTAVEYMLLLAIVVAIVLIAFKTLLPKSKDSSGLFFNKAAEGIMGQANPCGDCFCDVAGNKENCEKCPVDCGFCGGGGGGCFGGGGGGGKKKKGGFGGGLPN